MDFLSAWRGKRVLVTGGMGFIGRHVLAQGRRAGIELHSLSRRGESLGGVQHHQVDLRDRERVVQVVSAVRPAGVIHLAAAGVSYGKDNLGRMLQTNGAGTENLLFAADGLESKPVVVIAGSGSEYAPQDRPMRETDPIAPTASYGVSKVVAALCAGYYAERMPITVLRLFSIYGPGEQEPRLVPYIINRSRRGQAVELTGCEQLRDYTYVEEVGESFWRALSLPQSDGLRVFNVGTGHAITLKHLVLTLAELLRDEAVEPNLHFGAKPYRDDEPMVYLPSIAALEETFSWRPHLSLPDGIRRTLASQQSWRVDDSTEFANHLLPRV